MLKTDHASVQVLAVDESPAARELQIPNQTARTLGQLPHWLVEKVVANDQ
jgi:type II secretory pathway component PulL